jgi:oxygen-independent coproporphyrinogen-3 oxidase
MTCHYSPNDLSDEHRVYAKTGIYVHVPFCLNKCPYCDFFSTTDTALIPVYLSCLKREISQLKSLPVKFDSLYIGGGTPSVLKPQELANIIAFIRQAFKKQNTVETTVEVNPGTVSASDLKDYRSAGINRISIGIQSFNDNHLKFLGRIHNAVEAKRAFEGCRQAGFDNCSIDLMYGLPGQDEAKWLQDLKTAVALSPEHISCYMLTYATDTPLNNQRKNGCFTPLPDSRLRSLYETTIQYLSTNGFFQYEVSNFARSHPPDPSCFMSRHNLKYWTFAPYIGLGPAAHSYLSPIRYWNISDLQQYVRLLRSHCLPIDGLERLSKEQQIMEAIYLGLRLTKGLSIDQFNRRFKMDFLFLYSGLIDQLGQKKYLFIKDGYCRLSIEGMLLHESIAAMFGSQDLADEEGGA